MNDEILILQKKLTEMSLIQNVLPGEEVRMKDSDTLLILQRRMRDCDLKTALEEYNEIFGKVVAVGVDDLCKSMVSYIKIKVLVEEKALDFDPQIIRVLDKEFKNQMVKMENIIHLSKVNSMTADAYQKEQIEKTLCKNEAFLKAFEDEVLALAKRMEREPYEPVEEVKVEEPPTTKPKEKRTNPLSIASDMISALKGQKEVELRLKEEEKKSARTMCVEIPFYDKSLSFNESFVCKDIPAFSIYKRKGNIFFGLSKNANLGLYDNKDMSLVELTHITEEFLQFMSVDLLSGEYTLKPFSKEEKDSLKLYFDFVSCAFEKYMGVLLTVMEYLNFKEYYNRLVVTMFELEEKSKRDYYRALQLADDYIAYMECYGLCVSDEKSVVVKNIAEEHGLSYVEDLELLLSHHMVAKNAKDKLEELIQKIRFFADERLFNVVVPVRETCKINPIISERELMSGYIDPTPESLDPAIGFLAEDYNDGNVVTAEDLAHIQIKIQFQNKEHIIVDEALFAVGNVKQAVYDYLNKGAYIKKIGLYMNGKDVFLYSSKNASLSVAVLTEQMKKVKRLDTGTQGALVEFYEDKIRKTMIEFTQ